MSTGAFCTSCGAVIQPDWKFCENCGGVQADVELVVPPVPAAAPLAERGLLEAQGIEVIVGATTLLQPTDLTLKPGELVAIVGPSGSGKSTLLKTVGGIRPSSAGSVSVRGEDVGLRQADIGYVPQDDTLHHLLSIEEALTFAARLRLPEGHTSEEREAAISEVLDQVGLEDIRERRIGNLSGGQRKRAAVALELISGPELLLLDEPTTGLDPGLERRLMELTRRLADRGQGCSWSPTRPRASTSATASR